MLTGLSGSKAYRLRPAVKEDSYGDSVDDWGDPQRVRIPRADFQEGPNAEREGVRRLLEGEGLLLIVGRFDLTADDRVEVNGDVWRVHAKPLVRKSLATGNLTVAELRRVKTT